MQVFIAILFNSFGIRNSQEDLQIFHLLNIPHVFLDSYLRTHWNGIVLG